MLKIPSVLITYGPDFYLTQDLTSKKLIGPSELRDGVHYLKLPIEGSVFAAVQTKDTVLWHQRLGHPSYGSLVTLSSVYHFHLNKGLYDCCNVCHRAKQTRSAFPNNESRANKPFALIHCDL